MRSLRLWLVRQALGVGQESGPACWDLLTIHPSLLIYRLNEHSLAIVTYTENSITHMHEYNSSVNLQTPGAAWAQHISMEGFMHKLNEDHHHDIVILCWRETGFLVYM